MPEEPTPQDLDEEAFEEPDTSDTEEGDGKLAAFAGGTLAGVLLTTDSVQTTAGEIAEKTGLDESMAKVVRAAMRMVKAGTGVSVEKAMGDGGQELPAVVEAVIGIGEKILEDRDMEPPEGE